MYSSKIAAKLSRFFGACKQPMVRSKLPEKSNKKKKKKRSYRNLFSFGGREEVGGLGSEDGEGLGEAVVGEVAIDDEGDLDGGNVGGHGRRS